MGSRTSHPPGTFSWVDLATTDVDGASSFYGDLFGWTADVDGDAGHTTWRLAAEAVAGLGHQPADTSAWLSYVTVDDVEATVGAATELGGAVVQGPGDVGSAGRAAVLADPLGGRFGLWQPGDRIGAERVNDVGCLTMNELATPDLDAATAFYEALFGWRTEPVDTGDGGPQMRSVFNGDRLNATLTLEDGPPHWRAYFTVESVAAALERITALGGSTVAGPIPLPDGFIAIALDPQAAVFCLFEGEVDP